MFPEVDRGGERHRHASKWKCLKVRIRKLLNAAGSLVAVFRPLAQRPRSDS